jgi:UDP-glucose 4-epimerase
MSGDNWKKQLKGKRVLVTGGCGFVGSRLIAGLVNLDAVVTVLDDMFTGRVENLSGLHGVQVVEGSVTDRALVTELVYSSDYVAHLAARNIIASTKDPGDDFETNIGGTLNVLLAMRDSGARRMVYTSTASVYGNPKYLPVSEEEPLQPLSPYAVSKLAGEHYCLAFWESFGVPSVVVRYSNVYGINQRADNPYCGVVARFVESIGEGKPPQIHGDGLQTRDYTYVDDAVEGTLRALTLERGVGAVFNLGTGFETSVRDLACTIANTLGKTFQPIYVPRRDIDNIRRRALNVERARLILRWSPDVTLDEGIRRTVEWQTCQ